MSTETGRLSARPTGASQSLDPAQGKAFPAKGSYIFMGIKELSGILNYGNRNRGPSLRTQMRYPACSRCSDMEKSLSRLWLYFDKTARAQLRRQKDLRETSCWKEAFSLFEKQTRLGFCEPRLLILSN